MTLPVNDIDTDQIIPAQFLKVTNKNGLADRSEE
jgi:3-isopropylmalate dehydratase small subunit